MAVTLRSIVLAVVPTVTVILGGLLWFQRRRKPNKQLDLPKPPDKVPEKYLGNGDIKTMSPDTDKPFEVADSPPSIPDLDVIISTERQNVGYGSGEVSSKKSVVPSLAKESAPENTDAVDAVIEDNVLKSTEVTVEASAISNNAKEIDDGVLLTSSDKTSDSIVVPDTDRFQELVSEVSESVLDWAKEANDSLPDEEVISETIDCYTYSPLSSGKPTSVVPNPSMESKADQGQIEEEVVMVDRPSDMTTRADLNTAIESPQSVSSDSTDAHSEMSNDSGKASSINDMPLNTVTAIQEECPEPDTTSDIKVYEFDFPSDLIGMLIGRQGRGINHVKQHSGVEVTIKNKLYTADTQLVSLRGTSKQIEKALSVIKNKFPKARFKQFNLDFTEALPESPMLPPEVMQMSLAEGVLVDVTVSSVVSGNHIFVQQPTHPSFMSLETLNQCMMSCYLEDNLIPELPRPIEVGVICAAPMYDSWFRAQVVQTYPETDECDVKFVDYGGYLHVPGHTLKQIRSDFTALPFQTIECYLANVMPCNEAEEFDVEACAGLEELVRGRMLQAEIVSRDDDTGIPYINLYTTNENKSWLLNRLMVENGLATWAENQ